MGEIIGDYDWNDIKRKIKKSGLFSRKKLKKKAIEAVLKHLKFIEDAIDDLLLEILNWATLEFFDLAGDSLNAEQRKKIREAILSEGVILKYRKKVMKFIQKVFEKAF